MPEKKRFKCEICDYILEHDGDGELPSCPECGDAESWLLLDADATQKAAMSEPSETGFSQVIPHDITEGDVSAIALGNIALAPAETAAGEPKEGTDPFARPSETGFEHAVPADITERAPSPLEMGQLEPDQSKPIKLDEYPFKRPHDTGFEQIVPTDITEGDTSRAAYGSIVGPSGDEPVDTQAFARPAETGFEQVIPNDITENVGSAVPSGVAPDADAGNAGGKIDDYAFKRPHDTGFEQIVPTDITEGDTSRAAFGSIAGPQGDDDQDDSQAFARPETTGFEQVIPVDFTEGVGSSVDVAALPKDEPGADIERKPGVNPFAQPEETGFDQIVPQDFTEGGKVNIDMGLKLDGQQTVALARRFRCDVCGALIETDQEGDLPPCSTCGELGKWVPVKE